MSISLWQVALDWVPILFFAGFTVFFAKRMLRAGAQDRLRQTEYLAELRRHTEQLDRIARALEQRPPA